MANYNIVFYDFEDNQINMNVKKANCYNQDVIRIHLKSGNEVNLIDLDKSTAIKFAKTLRTEINKIKEVQDGNR